MEFTSVRDALDDLRHGRMIIVVDDPDRENEGDLIMAGEAVTPDAMNFMITHGRGVPFIATTSDRFVELGIPMMTKQNTARLGTAMGETVDALAGTTTGVSAADRAATVKVFTDSNATPTDLGRPGHMLTLRAERGGVLRRAGHTEASVDLMMLAGIKPVAAGCEILRPDGTMMRLPDLQIFAKEHGLKILTIADLIAYRRHTEKLIEQVAGPIQFPTHFGEFTIRAYESTLDSTPYIAIIKGDVATEEPVLVRMHSSCLTGDILGSLRCDCGDQLSMALQRIEKEGLGVVVYIAQEGRGIGILNKLKAYKLQDEGLDTVEANLALGFKADLRDYGQGAQLLVDLGIKRIRLMTNNPKKVSGLQGFGLEIVDQVPIVADSTPFSERYLETKREKMGHLLPPQE